jgi:antitoxin YefM
MGGAGIDYAYANAYNGTMKTASYSDLRRNLSTMLDQVNADHEPVIITRDKGKPAAVLMSLEDFASYEETRYLLKSPVNAARLLESIAELERGKGTQRKLDE